MRVVAVEVVEIRVSTLEDPVVVVALVKQLWSSSPSLLERLSLVTSVKGEPLARLRQHHRVLMEAMEVQAPIPRYFYHYHLL